MTKRPSAANNDPGFFYDQRRLLKYFAISSIVLMAGILALIWKDFDRPWKSGQRAAMKWEARRMALESFLLETQAGREKARLEKRRRKALAAIQKRRKEQAELDEAIAKQRGRRYNADINYKEQKQYTQQAEFEVREARSPEDLAYWRRRYREERDTEARLQAALAEAQEQLDLLLARRHGISRDLDRIVAEERANPALKRMKLLAAGIEKKRSYNPLREIPLLDFLAPPTKVEQVVLDNLVDNYEFATPKKVDRCGTCHINAMRVGFGKERFPIEAAAPETADPAAFERGVYRFVFGALDAITERVPAGDPFFAEKNKLRKVKLHHRTLALMFAEYDEEFGEIGTEEVGGKPRKIWRKWKRNEKTGRWVSGKDGVTLAEYYVSVLRGMRKQWRTHPHFHDMVGSSSPHPYERFGCTSCHQGRGWSTDFGFAWHAPDRVEVDDWMTTERAEAEHRHEPLDTEATLEETMRRGTNSISRSEADQAAFEASLSRGWVLDEEQAERWKYEQGRSKTKLKYWNWPQHPKSQVQASCLKCHKEGLYRPPDEEYAGVRVGKPAADAPLMLDWKDHAEEFNRAEAAESANRMFIPEEPAPYRPTELERGLDDFLRFGCFGCHKLDPKLYPFMELQRPKVGPPLDEIAAKTDRGFLLKWVRNPKDFRPHTRMPRFWGLSNNSHTTSRYRYVTGEEGELDNTAWSENEVYAIVEWILFESADKARTLPPVDLTGADWRRGERIVVGDGSPDAAAAGEAKACIACHEVPVLTDELRYDAAAMGEWRSPYYRGPMGWKARMSRRQGPSLAGIGSKVKPEWLYAWLKNPRAWWSHTNMPDLRLTDAEARDVAAYLSKLRNEAFEGLDGRDPVTADPSILRSIARELKVGEQRESATKAIGIVDRWSERERTLYVGEKLFKHYGCYGCHDIEKFRDATPIGTELTEWGSKQIERLEFNHAPIDHTRFDFAYLKMRNPRAYDRGMPRRDRPYERLRMPRFGFTPDEARELATFLIGLVSDPVPEASRFGPDTRQADILHGREVVRRYNCQGCHIIEGGGGDLWPAIDKEKWRPPDLVGQGIKTQPAWLFRFMKDPAFVRIPGEAATDRIRPWHSIRMPTFHLDDDEARAVVRYFAALSRGPHDFETPLPDSLEGPGARYERPHELEYPAPDGSGKTVRVRARNAVEEARALLDAAQCLKCHSPDATPQNAAPSFRHTRAGRLRGRWLAPWLWNPGKLLPGTSMPGFFVKEENDREVPDAQLPQFFEASPDRQIEALRDYIRFHYRAEDR